MGANVTACLEQIRSALEEIIDAAAMAYADGKLQTYEIPMIIASVTGQAYPLVSAFRGLSGAEFDDVAAAVRSLRFEVEDVEC
jgi:uncharacterized protein YukE